MTDKPQAVEKKSCRACVHLRRATESWEMPHIQWWECAARPSMENLRTFPFNQTICKKYDPGVRVEPIDEMGEG